MNRILKSGIQIFSLMGILFFSVETGIAVRAFAEGTPESVSKGHTIFSNSCEVCHTIGNGDAVGPDLKGVTSRREEQWLKNNIQHPDQMIANKDPIAIQLLEKYKSPMDNVGLKDEEVDEVIAYLKSTSTVVGTVETAAPLEKEKVIKKEATKEDISKGKALFQGEQRFFNKGPSCISCHDVRNSSVFAGGSLAKELTTAYSRLGDISTRAILKKPAFAVMRQAYKDRDLTDAEIDALTAFLENVDKEQGNQEPTDYRFKMLRGALIGLGVLFIFYFVFWFVGKRKSGGVS